MVDAFFSELEVCLISPCSLHTSSVGDPLAFDIIHGTVDEPADPQQPSAVRMENRPCQRPDGKRSCNADGWPGRVREDGAAGVDSSIVNRGRTDRDKPRCVSVIGRTTTTLLEQSAVGLKPMSQATNAGPNPRATRRKVRAACERAYSALQSCERSHSEPCRSHACTVESWR